MYICIHIYLHNLYLEMNGHSGEKSFVGSSVPNISDFAAKGEVFLGEFVLKLGDQCAAPSAEMAEPQLLLAPCQARRLQIFRVLRATGNSEMFILQHKASRNLGEGFNSFAGKMSFYIFLIPYLNLPEIKAETALGRTHLRQMYTSLRGQRETRSGNASLVAPPVR